MKFFLGIVPQCFGLYKTLKTNKIVRGTLMLKAKKNICGTPTIPKNTQNSMSFHTAALLDNLSQYINYMTYEIFQKKT
jgi:hypothetical protein